MILKTICVLAGSSPSALQHYRHAVDELVDVLVQGQCVLVFGGVDLGMMGYVAHCALHRKLHVIGVMPRFFLEAGLNLVPGIEVVMVDTMAQRLEEMCRRSDGFIALPGGYGTLEELFSILSMQQLGKLAKPCGVLNVGGFFDPLREQVRRAEAAGFVRSEHACLLAAASCPRLLMDELSSLEVPSLVKWEGLRRE